MSLIERSVRVGARDIRVATTGSGPELVLLHGGGPGASGVANWTRNIPALARHFSLVIPDLPATADRASTSITTTRSATSPLLSAACSTRSTSRVRTSSATPMAVARRCGLPSTGRIASTGWSSTAPAASAPPVRCRRAA